MTNADQAASPVYTPAVHRPAVVFDARASSEKDATVDDNKKRREQKKKEKKKRQREEKKKADAAAKYGPPPPAPSQYVSRHADSRSDDARAQPPRGRQRVLLALPLHPHLPRRRRHSTFPRRRPPLLVQQQPLLAAGPA
jgi:hypothetical protein